MKKWLILMVLALFFVGCEDDKDIKIINCTFDDDLVPIEISPESEDIIPDGSDAFYGPCDSVDAIVKAVDSKKMERNKK